ncbi:hypothetical protein DPSP01_002456 [Paraphaeosphaeria sporulosa]
MLHYISLSVCGPYDVLVLVDLPHVKKAGIHHLRGRAAHDELPFTKTKHVKTLRFAFSDTYAPPEGFLQVLTFVLDLFEAVRSVEVYNGMDLERARYLYEDVLLNLFASLGPSLEPHLDTLETPLLPGKFNQNGIWYALIPNLSTFHRLEALKIPEQLFNQHVRNVINGEAVTPEKGLWNFKDYVDEGCRWKGDSDMGLYSGYWTPPEGSKMKFRVCQDFYRNTWLG